ncbi:hypothetical protein Lal_00002276 [Lupinus albus]|nr:hypothetical protein Lal_00002276 [Lupinus albus]
MVDDFFRFGNLPLRCNDSVNDKIQRRFMWGYGEERKGIHWVRWVKVCRTKDDCSKWRWRLLCDEDSLCVKVLKSRYMDGFLRCGGESDLDCFRRGSSWWIELGCLSQTREGKRCRWVNDVIHSVWTSSLRLIRNLLTWDKEDLEELLRHINDSFPKQHTADFWIWIHDKSGHTLLGMLTKHFKGWKDAALLLSSKKLWDCNVPTKMKCLVWKFVLDEIPSKVNLAHKGGLSAQDTIICSLCGELEESTNHLFFACSISYVV